VNDQPAGVQAFEACWLIRTVTESSFPDDSTPLPLRPVNGRDPSTDPRGKALPGPSGEPGTESGNDSARQLCFFVV
jgi:hypothetical protein